MIDDAPDDPAEFGLVCPFWTDTDAYSDRDREIFVCGYEFNTVLAAIREHEDEYKSVIHRENESRVRLACGRFRRQCEIRSVEPEHDPQGTWSYLTIFSRDIEAG